jgi:hypothetical protein
MQTTLGCLVLRTMPVRRRCVDCLPCRAKLHRRVDGRCKLPNMALVLLRVYQNGRGELDFGRTQEALVFRDDRFADRLRWLILGISTLLEQ